MGEAVLTKGPSKTPASFAWSQVRRGEQSKTGLQWPTGVQLSEMVLKMQPEQGPKLFCFM